MTAVIVLTRTNTHLLYAEQLMTLLFATYFGYMINEPQSALESEVVDWVFDNWQAYILTKVCAVGFQSVGWAPVTGKLGLHGCNVKTPISGSGDVDKLIWVRMQNRAGTVATIRRRPRVIEKGVSEGKIYLCGQTQTQVRLIPDAELVAGKEVHITLERRLDRPPHDAPLFRLPLVGAFSDWREISSIGMRMEWQTTKGWRAKYVQKIQMNPYVKGQQHVPSVYIQGSALLAAFKSQVISNPSAWRMRFGPLRIVNVWFDQKGPGYPSTGKRQPKGSVRTGAETARRSLPRAARLGVPVR